MKLEIICQSLYDIIIATNAGIDRVELCDSLELDGLTPSIASVNLSSENNSNNIPINILIRPRSGNFIYSFLEKIEILKTLEMISSNKNYGFVFGSLDKDNNVDFEFLYKIKKFMQMKGLKTNNYHWTFHRAIDVANDWETAIPKLSEFGFNTILTSGGQNTVKEGLKRIERMVKIAGNNIDIMAGGGLDIDDISNLYNIGVKWVHSSASSFTSYINYVNYENFINSININTVYSDFVSADTVNSDNNDIQNRDKLFCKNYLQIDQNKLEKLVKICSNFK